MGAPVPRFQPVQLWYVFIMLFNTYEQHAVIITLNVYLLMSHSCHVIYLRTDLFSFYFLKLWLFTLSYFVIYM